MTDDNVIPFPGMIGPEFERLAEEVTKELIDASDSPEDALAAVLQLMGGLGLPGDSMFKRDRPTLLPRRPERVGYVVRVDLDDTRPPVWRRLRLASDLKLDQVHQVLQVAMGWWDYHLHSFLMGPDTRDHRIEPFVTPFDLEEGEEGIPEVDVRLDEVITKPGDRLFYTYDFGDDWEHTIKLEKVEPWVDGAPDAFCVTGRRACPPEDVGGVHGFADILGALAGDPPPHLAENPEWMEELLAWLPENFDPAAFSASEVNEALAAGVLPDLAGWNPMIADALLRAGGSGLSLFGRLITRALSGGGELTDEQAQAAARPYQSLLAAVGDGLSLTAAGYLPPRVVEHLFSELGLSRSWYGKGNREDQTMPVFWLRESATSMGLLRKARGRLLPTKVVRQVAGDPRGLLAHIGSRLPYGSANEKDAGLIWLLLEAADPERKDPELDAGELMSNLGWRTTDGGPMSDVARYLARPTQHVLEALTDYRPALSDEGDPALRATMARTLLRRV